MKKMRSLCILFVFFILILCIDHVNAEESQFSIREIKFTIANARLVLKDSQSSREARAAAIESVSNLDDLNTAVFLLKRLMVITKEVQLKWLLTQPRYGMVSTELLELEKGIGRYKSKKSIDLFLGNIHKLNKLGRLTLLQGLKECPGDMLDALYIKFLTSKKKPRERIISIDACGLRRLKETLPVLQKFCSDEKEPFGVRCASVRALARMPDKSSIEPLIECMKARGRLKIEASNTLWSLTGRNLPPLVSQWLAWWKENKESFVPPEDPLLHFNQEINGENEWEKFYGIPVVGDRIIFLLDRSGSMKNDKKLDGVKKELHRIAGKFNEYKFFNIMFFNHGTLLWQQKRPYLRQATAGNIERLDSYLFSVSPSGGTKIGKAMHKALIEIGPAANIETVFLLSDGLPNNDPYWVKSVIFHMNRYLKTRINTIYIADTRKDVIYASDDSLSSRDRILLANEFMEEIAGYNDGIYREISSAEANARVKK